MCIKHQALFLVNTTVIYLFPNSFGIYALLFDFSSMFFIVFLFSGLYQKNIMFCSRFSLGCRATNTFSIVAGL